MNKNELKHALDKEGIKQRYYSFNGMPKSIVDDINVVERMGKEWSVYYMERGTKYDEHRFLSEDLACKYLFEKLNRDPTTRIYNESKP